MKSTGINPDCLLSLEQHSARAGTHSARLPGNRTALFAIVIALAGYAILFPLMRPTLTWQTSDFTAYYRAGQMVREGQGALVYDFEAAKAYSPNWNAELAAVHEKLVLKRFVSAPYVLLIFAPLSYLSHYHAEVVWYAVNVCLMLAWPLLLRDILGRGKLLAFALLGPVLFVPVVVGIVQGQTSTLTLFLLALTYNCLRQGHDAHAGVLLALAGIKPQFVLPLLLAIIVVRKWRSVATFFSTELVLYAISAALVGWRTTFTYPAAWVRFNVLPRELGGAHVEGMPNIRGMLYVLLHTDVSSRLLVSLTLVATGLLLLLIASAVKRAEGLSDLVFGFAVMATLLASYYCYLFDLSLLMLAFVLALHHIGDYSVSVRTIAVVLTIGALYVVPFFSPSLEKMIVYLFTAMLLLTCELFAEIWYPKRQVLVGNGLCVQEATHTL